MILIVLGAVAAVLGIGTYVAWRLHGDFERTISYFNVWDPSEDDDDQTPFGINRS